MMLLQEAVQALEASWQGENVRFTGVSTDSRTLKTGDLFVALSGERYNGFHFVQAAQDKGAVGAMVELGAGIDVQSATLPYVLVKDTREGLGQLAAYWRKRFSIPIIAVTGSNGKTTVKDMLAAILSCAVDDASNIEQCNPISLRILATEGNLNNDIGLPLMLLRLREAHQFAVLEMGMNHMGEIAYLTQLAVPDVAVITNAGLAHIQGLGSIEAVARAKGEIFSGLNINGTAVINADDQYAELWRGLVQQRKIIDFGLNDQTQHEPEIFAEYQMNTYGSELQLRLSGSVVDVHLQVPGVHNIRNALAAAAAAVAVNIDKEAIVAGLQKFKGVQGRLQKKMGRCGAVLIDDSYNANPESVRAALAVLSAAKGKKILILGDMGELGQASIDLHQTIGREAQRAKLDQLLTLGELSSYACEAFGKGAQHFNDVNELLSVADNLLRPDATILVKGSRFMRMERVITGLAASSQGNGK